MGQITFDLEQLYQRTFGTKPVISTDQLKSSDQSPFRIEGSNPGNISSTGSALTAQYRGQEIWLPVKFFGLDASKFGKSELLLPYAVIKLSTKKHIIETPMAERQGSVKELYSIEDVQISLKGFLIGYDKSGKYPIWPEEELKMLKNLYSMNEALQLDNALSNDWIGADQRVVIKDLEFPEVQGGRKHARPFSMSLVSDSIFTLELK